MEKLKKEDVYVPLEGKSEEELTELWEFLISINKKHKVSCFSAFADGKYLHYVKKEKWWSVFSLRTNSFNKTEVTIQQLKEILQPMETLEQQLEKAKAEVKRLKKEINKIKIGDWVISELNDCVFKYQFGRLEDDLKKITDQELINKLNNLIN